ncbi:helix-turn-helix transcriptional regulator [Catenulispora sp. NF23]|uniref:helix-turn-helix domain-containing protein n=1 Tax=Catenulispora pinistramenti TaxID=2705254 RepID=UPI001BAC85FC|nr:helix-turn-helix transcriptional regulator [Catenulispora pinistramenti]MBS2539289.1 helix-turn-helix transcriptional regulator [Catenulispora pinistramenti]
MASVYAEHRPRRAPGRYVACTWTQANTGPGEYRQLVVPDGCVDLIWHDGTLELAGPDREAWVARVAPGAAFAGVRLRPGAARLLLGRMPVGKVRDRRVAPELATRDVAPLLERLHAAGSADAAVRVLDDFVAALTPHYEPDAAVERVVGLLRSGDAPHVPALADAVGLSERQLRRRFTEAVGYGPKTLHSILRFQHALDLGRAAPIGLAAVAYEAGYADQAHFTREVRRLAGMTPTGLLGVGG